jgi:hypothetical protein
MGAVCSQKKIARDLCTIQQQIDRDNDATVWLLCVLQGT